MLIKKIDATASNFYRFLNQSVSFSRVTVVLVPLLLGLHLWEVGPSLSAISSILLILLLALSNDVLLVMSRRCLFSFFTDKDPREDLVYFMAKPYRLTLLVVFLIIFMVTLASLAVNGLVTEALTAYLPLTIGILYGVWLTAFVVKYCQFSRSIDDFVAYLNALNLSVPDDKREVYALAKMGDLHTILTNKEFLGSLK